MMFSETIPINKTVTEAAVIERRRSISQTNGLSHRTRLPIRRVFEARLPERTVSFMGAPSAAVTKMGLEQMTLPGSQPRSSKVSNRGTTAKWLKRSLRAFFAIVKCSSSGVDLTNLAASPRKHQPLRGHRDGVLIGLKRPPAVFGLKNTCESITGRINIKSGGPLFSRHFSYPIRCEFVPNDSLHV